jgi:hypothetical protein
MPGEFHSNSNGQSLVELVITLGIFSLLASALIGLGLSGMTLLARVSDIAEADSLGRENLEALNIVRDRAWNELAFNHSAIRSINGRVEMAGEGTNEQIGIYTRYLEIFPVYRNEAGQVVEADTPGSYSDIDSRKAISTVKWQVSPNNISQREIIAYFTDWNTKIWKQSDWSGGEGEEYWTSGRNFYRQDGNISISAGGELSLKETATGTFAISGWLESSAFDSLGNGGYGAISWGFDAPGGCDTCSSTVQIMTALDQNGVPADWTAWSGPSGDGSEAFTNSRGTLIHPSHNGMRWIKYRINLFGNGSFTPSVPWVAINYR